MLCPTKRLDGKKSEKIDQIIGQAVAWMTWYDEFKTFRSPKNEDFREILFLSRKVMTPVSGLTLCSHMYYLFINDY
jgi:hypothetical protein